jgi:hypothetical protein
MLKSYVIKTLYFKLFKTDSLKKQKQKADNKNIEALLALIDNYLYISQLFLATIRFKKLIALLFEFFLFSTNKL